MNQETHLIMSPEEVDQLRIVAKAALGGDADLADEESDAVVEFRRKLFRLIPLYSDKGTE